jgi:hypothetical protein
LCIIRLLLDYRANPNYGTPLPIVAAVELGYPEIYNLLLERGAVVESGVVLSKRAG